MEFSTVKIKALLSLILTPIIAFYQPIESLLSPILWLVLIDIISGIYVAKIIEKKDLTSREFFRKLPQLAMFLLAISASLHADPFFVQFGIESFQSSKLVISFYGLYELFSILENLGKSGLPVAKQLANLLKSKLPEDAKQAMEIKNDNI